MDTLNNALVTRNTRDADIIQHVDILNDTITELIKYLQHSTKRTKPTRANSESPSDTDDRNYKRPKTNGPSTTELSSRGSTGKQSSQQNMRNDNSKTNTQQNPNAKELFGKGPSNKKQAGGRPGPPNGDDNTDDGRYNDDDGATTIKLERRRDGIALEPVIGHWEYQQQKPPGQVTEDLEEDE